MCGIIGLMSDTPVNQRVYDALHLLQHRGQDAAGIATLDGLQFHFFKGLGLVRDVFRTRNMRDLTGSIGIGHVRYPTQGNATSPDECQPFYVNAPFGIAFAHNGNLTNADDLRREHDLGNDPEAAALERRVKAFVQQYYRHLEQKDFTVE